MHWSLPKTKCEAPKKENIHHFLVEFLAGMTQGTIQLRTTYMRLLFTKKNVFHKVYISRQSKTTAPNNHFLFVPGGSSATTVTGENFFTQLESNFCRQDRGNHTPTALLLGRQSTCHPQFDQSWWVAGTLHLNQMQPSWVHHQVLSTQTETVH